MEVRKQAIAFKGGKYPGAQRASCLYLWSETIHNAVFEKQFGNGPQVLNKYSEMFGKTSEKYCLIEWKVSSVLETNRLAYGKRDKLSEGAEYDKLFRITRWACCYDTSCDWEASYQLSSSMTRNIDPSTFSAEKMQSAFAYERKTGFFTIDCLPRKWLLTKRYDC